MFKFDFNPPKMKTKKYTQEALEQAFQMVRDKKMSLGQAAKAFGIPKTTLGDKLRGRFALKVRPQTVLTDQEEGKLVAWLVESTRRGCGRNKQQLLTTVQHIIRADGRPNPFTNSRPGNKWYANFMARHPQLSLKKSQALGQQRALATEACIRAWFKEAELVLLEEGVDIKAVSRDRVFNCDETGFPFHTKTGYAVLLSKEDRQVYTINSDNKQVTVLACGSASGNLLEPLITYPGQRFRFNPQEQFPGSCFARSANGWIDSEIFQHWVQECFIPFTSHLAKPVFLFIDGHASHISLKMHDMCKEAGIVYYTLPTHASHIVQPLDLILFKSLKTEWTKAVGDFRDLKGENIITKANFALVLKDAWERAYSPPKLVNAFEAAGLCPWNPDRVDYRKCAASRLFTARAAPSPLAASSPSPSTASPCPTPCPSTPTPGPSMPAPGPSTPTPGPSTTAPRSPTPGPSSSSAPGPFGDMPNSSRIGSYVDKLLDFVVQAKWSEAKLFQIRRCFLEGRGNDDPEFLEYSNLYSKIVPSPSLNSLPLLGQWSGKSKRNPRVHPPIFVSGDKFREFFKRKVEEKERKLKEREEKKKLKEVERKRTEREVKGKRKEKEEKKKLKELERKGADREGKRKEREEKKKLKEVERKRTEREGKGKKRKFVLEDESSEEEMEIEFVDGKMKCNICHR